MYKMHTLTTHQTTWRRWKAEQKGKIKPTIKIDANVEPRNEENNCKMKNRFNNESQQTRAKHNAGGESRRKRAAQESNK